MIATMRQIIIRNFFCEQKRKQNKQINFRYDIIQGPSRVSGHTQATPMQKTHRYICIIGEDR